MSGTDVKLQDIHPGKNYTTVYTSGAGLPCIKRRRWRGKERKGQVERKLFEAVGDEWDV